MAVEKLTSDVYDIAKTINNIQKKFNPDINEDTLSMGIFGYITEACTKIAQNNVIMSAEYGNEAVYLRSKFEKTILSNAVFYNIKNINAIPAKMDIMLGFLEADLIERMGNNNFVIIDRDIPIIIKDEQSEIEYEFHLDYDLHISRSLLKNGSYAYSARYIIERKNPISDITNVFLSSPIIMDVSYDTFIFLKCHMRQVHIETIENTFKNDSYIYNKTFDFDFEDQLAWFDVKVTDDNNTETWLTPIFDNMPPITDNYCNYKYMDADTIRLKFNKKSYVPQSSSKLTITLYTTSGSEGNFKYKDDIQITLQSDKYGYDNFMCLVRPISESENGVDRKSIDDIKELIPKEVLSRGGIINNKDIENYFYNLDSTRLYFYQKRHNQIERLYYAYMLTMDSDDNIIPTNTINILLNNTDFDMIRDERLIMIQGKKIKYYDDYSKVLLEDEAVTDKDFIYSVPFTLVINTDPVLSVSYYNTNISNKYYFDYTYINLKSDLQFICNYMTIDRNYLENDDNYVIKVSLLQNITENFDIVKVDKETQKIIECDLKIMLVFENDNNKYYVYGKIDSYDAESFIYNFSFILDNDSMIDKFNNVRINHIFKVGIDKETYSFFPKDMKMKMYIYKKDDLSDNSYAYDIFNKEVEGYTLTNIFTTDKEVSLYDNYSENINSTVKVIENEDETYSYQIRSVPCIKHSYMYNIDKFKEFIDYISLRKAYIDDAVYVLENSFSVDLKFFNTYGKSKLYYVGHNDELLDRVNLSFKFRVKLIDNADDNIVSYLKDSIKEYIENINTVDSQHMANLCTSIKDEYSANIVFFEFVGLNSYDATYQYLEKINVDKIEDVPEFVNVNTLDDGTPDIYIEIV